MFMPQNLPLTNLNPVSGLFSIEAAHYIFKGHFRTSLLGLIEKPGKPGALQLIPIFLKMTITESTNGWLDSDDFPTKWYSAADCTDLMSAPLPFTPWAMCFLSVPPPYCPQWPLL